MRRLLSILPRKKVLVSSGAGFVGSNLIERLLELDADFTAILHNKKTVAIQENRITHLENYPHNPKTESRRLKRSVICPCAEPRDLNYENTILYLSA